jgi:hypothetical protein
MLHFPQRRHVLLLKALQVLAAERCHLLQQLPEQPPPQQQQLGPQRQLLLPAAVPACVMNP